MTDFLHAQCPKCTESYEIDRTKLPAPKIRLRCSRCAEVFLFEVDQPTKIEPVADVVEPSTPAESLEVVTFAEEVEEKEKEEDPSLEVQIINVEEVSQEVSLPVIEEEEERTETVLMGPRPWHWGVVVGVGLLLGAGSFYVWKEKSAVSTPPTVRAPVVSAVKPFSEPAAVVTPPVEEFPSELEEAKGPGLVEKAETVPEEKPVVKMLEAAKEGEGDPSGEMAQTEKVALEPKVEKVEEKVEEKKPVPQLSEEDQAEIRKLTQEFQNFTPRNFRQLRKKLSKAIRTWGDRGDLGLMSAEVHAYLGRREKKKDWIAYAYEAAFHWRQRHAQDPRGERALALAYVAAGQLKKALAPATKAAKSLAADPTAQYARALAVQGKSKKQGLKLLQAHYQKFPRFFPIGEALAVTYLQREQYKKAAEVGEKMLRLEAGDPILEKVVAEAYEGQGAWKKAAIYFERVVQRKPTWQGQLSLGRAYRKLKEFPNARAQLDKTLREFGSSLKKKERAQVAFERGKVDFDEGKFSQSIVYLKEAHRLNPTDHSIMQYLAGALFRVRRYAEAAKIYEQASLAKPDDLALQRYLGMARFEAGDMDGAEKTFRALILEGEDDALMNYQLARIRENRGDEAGAISYLQRALTLDPNYENARIRLDKIRNTKN